ncbi:MAG: M20/M25/M40 family metallo-hydrolase [Candidatus Omnitrophica bacterium]|nr:M20/M25/M40 family metallo-hydrolase [Candidatus Omnitrophota bacterium]
MAAPFHLIDEAKRLIRFNTVTWNSNADCAVYVGSLLRKLGAQISYQDSRSEDGVLFMNVAGLVGKGKGAPLLLTTHLDTVDSGNPRFWTKTGADPWKLTVRGDTLYGLGAADTKLDFLCKLLAVGQFKPDSLKRPVILLGTFGEESGLRGAARFCQGEFPRPEMALVGEPSELSLVTRHKGFAVVELLFKSRGLHRPSAAEWVYELTCTGRPAHSSTPDLGVNAIGTSIEFLRKLQPKVKKCQVLSWTGGTGHNIIPAQAVVRFSLGDSPKMNFRSTRDCQVRSKRLEPGWYPTLPWADAVWSLDTLGTLLEPLEKPRDRDFQPPHLTWNATLLRETKEGWSMAMDIRSLPGQRVERTIKAFEGKLWKRFGHPGSDWQFHLERENPALEVKRDAPVVRQAVSALRAARLPVKITAKSGCSEAGLYAKVGIPSVVIGPGRSKGNIHQPNESVSLRQLRAAVRFYEAFLKKICS